MSSYPPSIENLIRHLSGLPGIGEKTAERLAMYMVHASERDTEGLARAILNMKENVRLCSRCFGLSDKDICTVCANPARDATLLCVVETVADMVAIEKSGAFYGLYHILHGVLSPMDGVGPDDIRFRELMNRLETDPVKEIILALNTSVEGESTANYIGQCIARFPIHISRIASGVPMGGDLKFVDQVTLRRAMETRHVF